MRPMLVNSKQKIAVLASGLAIATTGFVTDAQASPTGDSLRKGAVAQQVEPAGGEDPVDITPA